MCWGGGDQILDERSDRQRHLAVRRIDLRQPSRGVGADPRLPLVEPDTPRLGVVTAWGKRGVVEDAMKVRWNERRRRRSRRLLDILTNDSFRMQQFHRNTPQAATALDSTTLAVICRHPSGLIVPDQPFFFRPPGAARSIKTGLSGGLVAACHGGCRTLGLIHITARSGPGDPCCWRVRALSGTVALSAEK